MMCVSEYRWQLCPYIDRCSLCRYSKIQNGEGVGIEV